MTNELAVLEQELKVINARLAVYKREARLDRRPVTEKPSRKPATQKPFRIFQITTVATGTKKAFSYMVQMSDRTAREVAKSCLIKPYAITEGAHLNPIMLEN